MRMRGRMILLALATERVDLLAQASEHDALLKSSAFDSQNGRPNEPFCTRTSEIENI